MDQDDFKAKVAFVVETDGLLTDYIDSVVIKQIKSSMTNNAFKCLNANQIHAALVLKNIAPCPLKAFAAALRLSKSAASALVDRMVTNRLVDREVNPENRREVLLVVSPDFEKYISHVRSELNKWFEKLTTEMGWDAFEKWHEAMVTLNHILKKEIRSNHVS